MLSIFPWFLMIFVTMLFPFLLFFPGFRDEWKNMMFDGAKFDDWHGARGREHPQSNSRLDNYLETITHPSHRGRYSHVKTSKTDALDSTSAYKLALATPTTISVTSTPTTTTSPAGFSIRTGEGIMCNGPGDCASRLGSHLSSPKTASLTSVRPSVTRLPKSFVSADPIYRRDGPSMTTVVVLETLQHSTKTPDEIVESAKINKIQEQDFTDSDSDSEDDVISTLDAQRHEQIPRWDHVTQPIDGTVQGTDESHDEREVSSSTTTGSYEPAVTFAAAIQPEEDSQSAEADMQSMAPTDCAKYLCPDPTQILKVNPELCAQNPACRRAKWCSEQLSCEGNMKKCWAACKGVQNGQGGE
ncbi:MAG: hypothetical protein M1831_000637 [Alyxoria varia]|nr:MAG: hypothetical protein M1831_000637 [Alyxoria varia]